MAQISFPYSVIIQNKGSESFTDSSYVAAGGEGTILKKGGKAYKIYHDESRMIPVGKIQELQALSKIDNILGPQDILFDSKRQKVPIGFSMPFIKDTEFLCKLFNQNFKNDNNIDPDTIIKLIRKMQETLTEIHNNKILVVDFNEMNFLMDKKTYTTPYFIDVDSYQTPSHRATAIMESIRDRKITKNQWTPMSDWFSFGVVAFQIYMGVHPFRGKHPDYKPNQWPERMEKNISVFCKGVQLPQSCPSWDVIPKPHLEWFKAIFDKGDRSVPPMPDGVAMVAIQLAAVITSTGKFDVKELSSYDDNIRSIFFYNGYTYTITNKGIYKGAMKFYDFKAKLGRVGLIDVPNSTPLIVIQQGDTITFKDEKDVVHASITADDAMEYNGRLYTLRGGSLSENYFENFNKPLHMVKKLCSVFESATKLYKGVAVQDVLGKCWLAIPFRPGSCINVPIKELDGYRIVGANYDNRFCILMAEKKGKYSRFILFFNKEHNSYTCRVSEDVDFDDINFTVNAKGVCILAIGDDKVEVFKDNEKVYDFGTSPFNSSMKLITDGITVMFINKKKLYSVNMKA
jgi:tRNA A-37 threonylcarbamoyl transferase component Bud32